MIPVTAKKRTHTVLVAIAVALLALALAAAAAAAVSVYSNDFSTRGEYAEIQNAGGGKRCDRSYRQQSNSMHASVENAPATCPFRPPVEGDGELPDHDVRVEGKILDKTPNSVRGGAFLEVGIRIGGGGVGYFLRVFPEKGKFELTRGPAGGGDFPVRGKSDAIKKVGERNQLRLLGTGADVRAFVNGEEVAKATDDDPGQVPGRKIRFALGNQKDAGKNTIGTFKRVSVSVPD